MKLLIVESPGKIKKLQSFLPAEWRVAASVGHIRDLPNKNYGLQPPDYHLKYEVTKPDVVKKLKGLIEQADEVYLASDPDREGEAIAWHLKDVFGLKKYKRITFGAITKEDVLTGVANPRDIDMNLVYAQEARRALDRLVGYQVSAPLGEAVSEAKMSAGRVQSPAVRIVYDREQERKHFVSTTHYDVSLTFEKVEQVSDGWKAVWMPKEGWLDAEQPYFLDESTAKKVAGVRTLTVDAFEEKEGRSAPAAPFTTSSLQQVANKKLKLSPKRTMELAQKLYEGGHITYMRTDSPNFSETAIAEIRAFADAQGLPLPEKPRVWKSKEGAQEAHEAIRPTHIDVTEVTVDVEGIKNAGAFAKEAQALYTLIRDRALVSQLADAVYSVRVARLSADVEGKQAVFEAKGRTLVSPGWKVVAGNGSDDDEGEPENAMPVLKAGSQVVALQGDVQTKKTTPPARYTQASIIAELEKRGIGRPATYAAILDTIIQGRDYLSIDKSNLVPTARGEKLVTALQPVFSFLDLDYTKKLEDALDDVAAGKVSYKECIHELYSTLQGELDKFIEAHVVPCPSCGDRATFRHVLNPEKGWNFWSCKACGDTFSDDQGRPGAKKEAPALTEFTCDKCGQPLRHCAGTSAKTGKAYDFFACSNKDCGAKYDNVDGQPAAKKDALSEHLCKKCGKPLKELPTRKGGIWFACSNEKCKQRYWDNGDGSPDYDNPPK